MLYALHEAGYYASTPLRIAARLARDFWGSPLNPANNGLPGVDPSFSNSYDYPIQALLGIVTEVDAKYNFQKDGSALPDGAALKRLRVQSWSEFSRAVKGGAGAGRVAGTVVSRTERRTKTGSKMGIIGLSDPTGHYEAVLSPVARARMHRQHAQGQ